MITAVIPSYSRPSNVPTILDSLLASSLVTEVILWSDGPLQLSSEHQRRVTVIQSNKRNGLFTRLMACLLAKNDLVLTQDDDWLVPESGIAYMAQGVRRRPLSVHGVFGRNPNEAGQYAAEINDQDANVEMVLTCACMFVKELAAKALALAYSPSLVSARAVISRKGWGEPTNGEDIILSYAAIKQSGLLNFCYGSSVRLTSLNSTGALSDSPNHKKARTAVMQACRNVYQRYESK